MKSFIHAFLADESGAAGIEYGLLAALIAVVIIAAVASIGRSLKTAFESIATCLSSPTTCGVTPPAGG